MFGPLDLPLFCAQIGCVFNHREFYANKQPSDVIEGCSYNFMNDRAWKAMDSSILMAIRHVDAVPLCPPTLDVTAVSNAIQEELKAHIASHRTHAGVSRCCLLV